jgi:hypothetical protein
VGQIHENIQESSSNERKVRNLAFIKIKCHVMNSNVSCFSCHGINVIIWFHSNQGTLIRYGSLLGGSIDGSEELKPLGLDERIYKVRRIQNTILGHNLFLEEASK